MARHLLLLLNLRVWIHFLCLLGLSGVSSISLSLNPVQPSIHIIIFKMGTGVWTLILLAWVVVEVYSLVIDQIQCSIILFIFAILSSFIILCLRYLVKIRAVLKITILHRWAVNMVSIIWKNIKYRILINYAFWFFKFKISGFRGIWVFWVFWVFGYLGLWVFGYFGYIGYFGYFGFGYLGLGVFGYIGYFGYFEYFVYGYMDIWVTKGRVS